MPVAIEFFTWVAAVPREDRKLVVRSQNVPGELKFDLDRVEAGGNHHWGGYMVGVAKALDGLRRRVPGANLLIKGNVPQGSRAEFIRHRWKLR